jgi:hypothetical protein
MDNRVYVLRVCSCDMTSHGGFQWPESGLVEAPDWDPTPKCGNGLHGWLHGEGDVSVAIGHEDPSSRWLIVAVDRDSVVDLGGKVKFPRGEVIYCGSRDAVVAEMRRLCPGRATLYGTATAGDHGTATAGNYGAATAGTHGTATAGNCGTATAGAHGTATAGKYGTATAGDHGTATAGEYGTTTAGEYGTATAGDRGTIQIRWYDGNRCRIAVGYVGEDNIEADVPYVVRDGKLVRKDK